MEQALLDWIQSTLRCGVLDRVMVFVSRLGDGGALWIVLAVGLMLFKRTRRAGAALACALALEAVCCNLILKPLVGRTRPFVLNPAVSLLTAPPGDGSFPSGHTAASFAAAFSLRGAGCGLWKPALALAAAVGFSRLYLYVHWPSDVLAGALLGAVMGALGARVVRQLGKRGP